MSEEALVCILQIFGFTGYIGQCTDFERGEECLRRGY